MPRHSYRRIQTILVASALLAVVLWCAVACTAEHTMQSRIAKLLQANDYTMFTPFRAGEYPGTIMVLTRNEQGRWTEYTMLRSAQTFDLTVKSSDLYKPQQIDFADTLTDNFDVSGNVAFDILSILLNAEAAAQYATTITIAFDDPKTKYVMTDGDLAKARYSLSAEARDTFTWAKTNKELQTPFILMEVLEVQSLRANVTIKHKARADIGLEKIADEFANVHANVSVNGDQTLTVSSKEPILIGYKARRVPNTILGTVVGTDDKPDTALIPANDMVELKQD